MNKLKMFFAKTFFKELLPMPLKQKDASGSTGGGAGRELASEYVKRVTFKDNSDTDFEDPNFDLEEIQTGYNTDSYIRQGVDKYVDQIFKEGYKFYGTDTLKVDYIKLRLAYIAEATGIPTNQFLIDIAEDLVKYGNCMIVKARNSDPNALPQGVNVQGLYGKDPVVGYFCANPITMKCKRDEYGVVTEWQQETDGNKATFNPEDVVHFYYKREKGNAYGTSFLVPVLDDVRALRQAEENVLKMMYRNIYPFYHVAVGTEEQTGTSAEVDALKEAIDGMDIEGGLVTTERVEIKPIATDKVIDAEPYLKYMESRVFSGFGIPEVNWGRGGTASRSSSDNMMSEMADRIRAISRIIEMFFNEFIIKELLMEGGYDPVLDEDSVVEFRFNDNDVDVMIKKQVHAIYKYEHNAITENEMRDELGMDPIPDSDRELMFVELITRKTLELESALSSEEETGTSETNNKVKNQGGGNAKKKTSSSTSPEPTKKQAKTKQKKDARQLAIIGLIKDSIDDMESKIDSSISSKGIDVSTIVNYIMSSRQDILHLVKNLTITNSVDMINKIIDINKIFMYNISNDLMYNTSTSIIDVLDVRINLYRDSILNYIDNTIEEYINRKGVT